MDDKKESIEGKRKTAADYVRRIIAIVFGLFLLATLAAAVYRKFIE